MGRRYRTLGCSCTGSRMCKVFPSLLVDNTATKSAYKKLQFAPRLSLKLVKRPSVQAFIRQQPKQTILAKVSSTSN